MIHPKKWALISRKFVGRNQHQIKNRFITLLSNQLSLKRKAVSTILKSDKWIALCKNVIENIKAILQTQENNQKNQEENLTFELNWASFVNESNFFLYSV